MIPIFPSAVLARRKELREVDLADISNAGLALDRYLQAHKPIDKKERDDLVKQHKTTYEEELLDSVALVGSNSPYEAAFQRWKDWLVMNSCVTLEATLASSLAVGLGNESPLEVGLTVHHTYGMPIIPGSAIKGVCLRGAKRWQQQKQQELKRSMDAGTIGAGELSKQIEVIGKQLLVLFGDTAQKSSFVFWDAWYDPESPDDARGKPFHRDVITVHHPKYYQGADAWPTDFDDPTPIPFLVVRPGARFLFAISAPTKEWGKFAKNLLSWCLQNLGIGGKTNAGYGYFTETSVETQSEEERDALLAHLAQSGHKVSKKLK